MHKPSHLIIDTQIDAAYLGDNCDVRTKELVKRTFDPEKVLEMKEQYFQISKKLTARQELLVSVQATVRDGHDIVTDLGDIADSLLKTSEEYGGPIKSAKKDAEALLKKITAGYEISEEELFGFAYHEAGYMAYYDVHGLFVHDRRLRPGENQTRIKTIGKTA